MHCCASSAAKEEALIPWTRDPSGRLQSQQKSEFRRTTDLPCHATQLRRALAPVRLGRVPSTTLNRLQGRTLVWSLRSGWTVAPIALLQLAAFPDGLLTNHRCQMPLRATPLSVRFGSRATFEEGPLVGAKRTFAKKLMSAKCRLREITVLSRRL